MAVKTRVFLIDSNQSLAGALHELFDQHGEFVLDHFDQIDGAIAELAGAFVPDLVIVRSRQGALTESPSTLRAAGFSGSILVIGSEVSRRSDDDGTEYLALPVRFGILLSCMRRIIREREHSEEAIVQIGPFRFAPGEKTLTSPSGDMTALTDKEAAILKALHRAQPRPLSRSMLLEEVWGYNAVVTTHTLETHIYRLRQKLTLDGEGENPLMTEEGGYSLAALPPS